MEDKHHVYMKKIISISEKLKKHCEYCGRYINNNLDHCVMCNCLDVRNIIKELISREEIILEE